MPTLFCPYKWGATRTWCLCERGHASTLFLPLSPAGTRSLCLRPPWRCTPTPWWTNWTMDGRYTGGCTGSTACWSAATLSRTSHGSDGHCRGHWLSTTRRCRTCCSRKTRYRFRVLWTTPTTGSWTKRWPSSKPRGTWRTCATAGGPSVRCLLPAGRWRTTLLPRPPLATPAARRSATARCRKRRRRLARPAVTKRTPWMWTPRATSEHPLAPRRAAPGWLRPPPWPPPQTWAGQWRPHSMTRTASRRAQHRRRRRQRLLAGRCRVPRQR